MVAPTPQASKKRLSSGAQYDPSDTLHWEGSNMRQCYQRGCLRRTHRKSGPDCWEFLWRENDVTGKRVRRNKVIGTVTQFQRKTQPGQKWMGYESTLTRIAVANENKGFR